MSVLLVALVVGGLLGAAAYHGRNAWQTWLSEYHEREAQRAQERREWLEHQPTVSLSEWRWPKGVRLRPFDWESPDRWATKWLRKE